jgi:hypothetical protein
MAVMREARVMGKGEAGLADCRSRNEFKNTQAGSKTRNAAGTLGGATLSYMLRDPQNDPSPFSPPHPED